MRQSSLLSGHSTQASTTTLGSGQLADLLNHSGLTSAGYQILNGIFLTTKKHPDPLLMEFISPLAIPKVLQTAQPISMIEISAEEYSKTSKKWKELTATSPSGRHR